MPGPIKQSAEAIISGVVSTISSTATAIAANVVTLTTFITGLVTGASGIVSSITHYLNTVPVLQYLTAPGTRTNGQFGTFLSTALGYLLVSSGDARAGEDLANDVMRVEGQFNATLCTADTQVKAAAGFLHTVVISCNDAAPTAGSVIIYNNTAESGTQVFNHTFTTTPFAPICLTFDCVMSTGIYVGFTTTNDVNVTVTWR